jgi:hypothetical protein
VQAPAVVENFDVLGDGEPGSGPVAKVCRWYISFFRVAKNDLAVALSQQTPVRSRLRRRRFFVMNTSNSADVY